MLSPEVNERSNNEQQNASKSCADSTTQEHVHQVLAPQLQTMTSHSKNEARQFGFKTSVVERVKSALHSVSTHPVTSQAPISLQSPTLPVLPNTNLNITARPKIVRQIKNKKVESKMKALNVTPATLHLPSNVVVKNRFKHSRPMLAGHAAPEKKVKTGLEQICDNYNNTASTSQSEVTCLSGNVSMNGSTMQVTAVQNSSLARAITASSKTPMPSVSAQKCGANSLSVIICPACRSQQTTSIGNNCYKCFSCNKTYIVPLHRVNVQPPTVSTTAFYSLPPNATPVNLLNPIPSKSPSRKRASSKAPKKKKEAETIDLVSSDEEEKYKHEIVSSSSASTSTDTSSAAAVPTSQSEPVGIASRMKLPGGALPNRVNTPTPPPPSPSPTPSPGPSETPPPPVGEYKFHCNKAMFGELYGQTLAPTRVADNRMYLSLECIIYRNEVAITEKYTLSVGQNDVQQIMIYFGRIPSFVAIETSSRFAEVACRRIGRDVLVSGAPDPKKRYIILALVSAFKNDNEAAVEIGHLISCVSPWARVKLLTLEEAIELIDLANLDVNQKELCYGTHTKPTGPVETLLIYPSPPKTGGIPVTNEDVACLAEGIYLNDIIIDFYLKYLFEAILTPSQREKTYIFNSYFYKRLTQKQGAKSTSQQMHASVKKWTRNVDIFDKDFIVIPINEHCHWYLAVVCFPGEPLRNTDDLNEKDEEIDEEETADFIKETAPNGQMIKSNDNAVTSGMVNSVHSVIVKSVHSGTYTNGSDTKDGLLNIECSSKSNGSESDSQSDTTTGKVSPTEESMEVDTPIGDTETANVLPTEESTEVDTGSQSKDGNIRTVSDESQSHNKNVADTEPAVKEKIVYPQANEIEEFQRPCILIFDSLVGSGHNKVFTNLRNYMTEEWSSRKPTKPAKVFCKSTMKGCYPKIPRQNNDCDCGVFLLQYVESFFTNPITSYRLPVHLEEWFTLEFVSKKREQITDLINTLAMEYRNNSTERK